MRSMQSMQSNQGNNRLSDVLELYVYVLEIRRWYLVFQVNNLGHLSKHWKSEGVKFIKNVLRLKNFIESGLPWVALFLDYVSCFH